MIFAHPLAITDEARARFNIGPVAFTGRRPFGVAFERRDWDRSSAIVAPGQSESPASPHFADLAKIWADGGSIPLWFTDRAVQANAAATLTLEPVRSRDQ